MTVWIAKAEGYAPTTARLLALPLPTDRQAVVQSFGELGIDRSGGYLITSHDSPVWGIHHFISRTTDLNHLNYIARLLETLSLEDIQKLNAVVTCPHYIGSETGQLINVILMLNRFTFLEGVTSFEELSRHIASERAHFISREAAPFFDHERHGQAILYNDIGQFSRRGYVAASHATLRAITASVAIPEEHVILPVKGESVL